ncbi:GatB/YqeY domain-containing protein [Proteobacteria bacterium 005FR1]|nr:GatB/YqeY domain-containing protein [Proteobacteria bacterium 005FR1]
MSALKNVINEQMKSSMKAKDKERTGVLRMILAECKRVEVDERIELTDERVLAILDKMTKQRRDSAQQYQEHGRPELAERENYEIAVISEFLPEALSPQELESIVDKAVADSGAAGPGDMGKVMGLVKPQVQGRADMTEVSKLVRQKLA